LYIVVVVVVVTVVLFKETVDKTQIKRFEMRW